MSVRPRHDPNQSAECPAERKEGAISDSFFFIRVLSALFSSSSRCFSKASAVCTAGNGSNSTSAWLASLQSHYRSIWERDSDAFPLSEFTRQLLGSADFSGSTILYFDFGTRCTQAHSSRSSCRDGQCVALRRHQCFSTVDSCEGVTSI